MALLSNLAKEIIAEKYGINQPLSMSSKSDPKYAHSIDDSMAS
jgi:hypothetical protein